MFSNNLCTTIQDLSDLAIFSNALSKAFGRVTNTIHVLQWQDRPEPWGLNHPPHLYGYGRDIQFAGKNNGIVPAWVGLVIDKNNADVVEVAFNNKLIKALDKINAITSFPWVHAVIPSHCNSNASRTEYLEVALNQTSWENFKKNNQDPKILADFLDEIAGVLQ